MVKLGNVDKVLYYLRKREQYCHAEIYSDVESDPSVECIMRGVEAMRAFQPDVIIAIGGGSAIDAAKGMWLFYEHPTPALTACASAFWISANARSSSRSWARKQSWWPFPPPPARAAR